MIKKFLLAVSFFLTLIIVVTIVKFITTGDLNFGKGSTVIIGNTEIKVELADTQSARIKGLSGREALGNNEGMLFVFPEKSVQKFWMKEMKFPIDIIWIDGERIAGIVYGAEPETGDQLTIYSSPEPVDKVLEVNAGTASAKGIRVGDVISLNK